MISHSNIIYFIDPVVDHIKSQGSTELLVLVDDPACAGYSDLAGTIAPLGRWYCEEGAVQYLVGGRSVEGIPLSPTNAWPVMALGFLSEDLFVLGQREGVGETASLTNPLRSDAGTWPEGVDSIRVRRWCAAAPWASALWPVPGEDQAVTNAKIAVARMHWRHRYLQALIYRAVVECNEWDELNSLNAAGYMVEQPAFDHVLTADALLPTSVQPTDEELDKYAGNGMPVGVKLTVQTQMLMDHQYVRPPRSADHNYAPAAIAALRRMHGPAAQVGTFFVVPTLRSLTHPTYEG
ncbi:hypothetical protein SEA_RIZWANA_75 [Arthrobacter phage Rizwana]|nr:hypothetical protein SEA_RIZWANA_75 [Arthrobacter phage Rizwana]